MDYDGELPLLIADCGCGPSGIVTELRNMNYSERNDRVWSQTTVHGFDLDDSIKNLEYATNRNPKFVAHVGNMCSKKLPQQFHVILFCLSLFEDEITRFMDWCDAHIRRGGIVFIIENEPDNNNKVTTLWMEAWSSRNYRAEYKPLGKLIRFSFRKL